jgi:hypothetical protein
MHRPSSPAPSRRRCLPRRALEPLGSRRCPMIRFADGPVLCVQMNLTDSIVPSCSRVDGPSR